MSDRKSVVRKAVTDNVAAGDESYVVDLYEDGKLVMVHSRPGQSLNEAQSISRNWDAGTMQMLTE